MRTMLLRTCVTGALQCCRRALPEAQGTACSCCPCHQYMHVRAPHHVVHMGMRRKEAKAAVITCIAGAWIACTANVCSTCRTLTTDDRQIHCKPYSRDAEGLSIVGSASHMNDLTKAFMDKHKNPSMVQVGSSLKFLLVRLCQAQPSAACCNMPLPSACKSVHKMVDVMPFKLQFPLLMQIKLAGQLLRSEARCCSFVVPVLQVAEGLAHVYPRLAPTCEWDTAAAHIVVEEAGGTVLQAGLCDNKGNALEDWEAALAKGKPVVYNKENVLNPYFVVYGRQGGGDEVEATQTQPAA